MPKVSVVSVFHNRARFVRRTVESLLQQDFDDYEVVLVDDGSTDGTEAALRAYEGGRVRVIAHANKGFTQSLRDVLETVDCRYIAIQGSGDSSLPARLRLQAQALDQHRQLAVVGGAIEVIDPDTGRIVRERRDAIGSPATRVMLGANPFAHGETMYRADFYRACGGYRPFFTFAQDRDLFCRLSRRGEFLRIPEKVYTRLSFIPGSVSSQPRKHIQQALFSAFAVHCHAETLAGRPDPLDAYGPVAALAAGRSPIAARTIRRAIARSLAYGQHAHALDYARFLHSYAPGVDSMVLLAASQLGVHMSRALVRAVPLPAASIGDIPPAD